MSKDRAAKIKLLLFDVDGVLTDGKIWVLPAPAGSRQSTKEDDAKQLERGGFGLASGEYLEAKGFNAHDGTAISLARLGGIKTGLITKRISETVALRARDLRLDHVCQGIHDKFTASQQVLDKEGLGAEGASFIGDDIIDFAGITAMRSSTSSRLRAVGSGCWKSTFQNGARKAVVSIQQSFTVIGGLRRSCGKGKKDC